MDSKMIDLDKKVVIVTGGYHTTLACFTKENA